MLEVEAGLSQVNNTNAIHGTVDASDFLGTLISLFGSLSCLAEVLKGV